ncbi:hypothetical protein [Oceanidesulfovibrio indonesiensis]|uniref:hypothetical protein n=1 Tax=Oceanidesulfovibrio indonesiensis TaxID=54767 RepID=UPI0011867ECA|nr:hypothetical protein [Oceanidesulfovibrio indonesiensis]
MASLINRRIGQEPSEKSDIEFDHIFWKMIFQNQDPQKTAEQIGAWQSSMRLTETKAAQSRDCGNTQPENNGVSNEEE